MTRREIAALEDDNLSLEYDHTYAGEPLSNDADKPAADGALVLRLECMRWMQEANYPVENVTHVHPSVSVKPDGEDSAHLVCKIRSLSKPIEQADAASDNYEFWACSCPDYHYRRFPDLDGGDSIESVSGCVHVEKVRRRNRETTAENQTGLGEA